MLNFKTVNMRNIQLAIIAIALAAITASCENTFGDFLEKAPGVDVTEDTIFSSKAQVETFVASAYYWGMHTDLARWDEKDKSDTFISAGCEEAEAVAPWFWTHWTWNTGAMSPVVQADMRWIARWKAIRIVNILIERINDVPADIAYISQVEGEAKFIRALNYFEMFKHYGGVPIVDHRFQLGEDFLVQRSSLQKTFDFIIKDCDDAIKLLPATYQSQFRGRATKLAAYALKSKALLFAASPQFNTDKPILELPGHNDLICFGNYDANRWQLAADAAKEAIDAAPAAGCFLVTDKGVDKNYRYVWEQMDNTEIILADKSDDKMWFRFFVPASMNGMMGNTLTLNFLKYYEKKDGTSQTWDMNGGNDLNKKYDELDPRFKQTIAYNGSYWNKKYPLVVTTTEPVGRDLSGCTGGAWIRKPVPDESDIWGSMAYGHWPIFKLNELYLNYAEAINEAQGPVKAAYDAVSIIRARSGMPAFPSGLTQEQFRTKLRNERAIELAYDGHRIFDERRWLISDTEGLMKGNMWGMKIYAITGSSDFRYEPYVFSVRTFFPRMYLHPFMQNEVDKGYLIQNPGY